MFNDPDIWTWFWTILTMLSAVVGALTMSLRLLPFAFGGLLAAILAWSELALWSQWVVFVAGSIGALWWLSRVHDLGYSGLQDGIGVDRFSNIPAMVTRSVGRHRADGQVRVGSEVWRATTPGADLPVETPVRVVGMSGSRLIVTAVDETPMHADDEQAEHMADEPADQVPDEHRHPEP